MKKRTEENLRLVRSVMKNTTRYYQAAQLVEFDQTTVCPEQGKEEAGETIVALLEMIYRLRHEETFLTAAEELYQERESLNVWERLLSEMLHRERVRTEHYSAKEKAENEHIKNRAWIDWVEARERNDFSFFAPSFDALRKSEMHRVSLWDDPVVKDMSLYDRMIREYERGITGETLDALFSQCKNRILPLLKDISRSKRQIRKDFLHRKVTKEEQERLSAYLLSTIRFDHGQGLLAESASPFTEIIGQNDIRIAVHYEPYDFMSTFYTVLHEAGHAIFEQLQPPENYAYFLNEEKSRGMHESVSRFYENFIGRSRAFIHLVYPTLCDILPRVFFDVSEAEFYDAVNEVCASPIRRSSDQVTYIIHIMIRYEIERDLIDGELQAADVPRVWKEKYEEYLGVTPENDVEGCLQDITWTSYFGYFPTYALGDFYSAMYYRTMNQDFDVEEAVLAGDFEKINQWLKERVFKKSVLLPAEEWIRDITGHELSANDLLTLLEEKYDKIYDLSNLLSASAKRLYGYSRRMSRIRMLSTMQIDSIPTAEAYRTALSENFRSIGELAEGNREVVDELIRPMLENEEELSEKTIQTIRSLNDSLLDIWTHDNVDLPMMSLLSERLMKDAMKKDDDDYLVRQLDEEINACTTLILQTRRIITDTAVTDAIRKRGEAAFDKLISFMDHDKFLKLSPESRELVMINSRFGIALYGSMIPLSRDERELRLFILDRAMKYTEDPFYRENLPGYDWEYHLYRLYQYYSAQDEYNNVAGYTPDQLAILAEMGEKMEELWLSNREKFEEVDTYGYVHSQVMRNRLHTGKMSVTEYRGKLLTLYKTRDKKSYRVDNIISNLDVPREYIDTFDRDNLREEDKMQINAMYNAAISYVFGVPKVGAAFELMDYYAPLLFRFMEVPGGLSFEEMGLKSFAAFHPPTYIHSLMVAQITVCLTSHLLRKKPELFVGFSGYDTLEAVAAHREEIENFAYHAALCHDFGKLIIIDTVIIYGRKILDFEFDLIRQHPALGAMMLSLHTSTKAYAPIARGHHLWYDCSRGYPINFDPTGDPIKTLIDIVAVADCMDAATDSVGRSYNKGKTIDDFVPEVKEGAGTRYAPCLAELLEEEEVRRDLDCLLTERRQQAYLRTYNLLRGVQEFNVMEQ